ncbi:MAG: NAD(P)-dependent oxidoreductase [Thermoplasmatales archaeon]|nr:NAD(P)-dependent oxidoreductase [Thermoplasmatales archaeon]MCW6170001.1 NAD(P)-dependent oxidoreductase [Thermoplasmatales archaeon]
MSSNIGFVGTGKMGSRIISRILQKYEVTGAYNRTKEKLNQFPSLRQYQTPALLAAENDIIFIMLTDDNACGEVVFGEDGILSTIRPKSIIVNLSTVSYKFAVSCASALSEHAVHYLDCPVLGSIIPAEQGKLTALVSGEEDIFNIVKGVIETFSSHVLFLGPAGNAIKGKLANNLLMATNFVVASEAILFLEKSGFKREIALDILLNGGGSSKALESKVDDIKSEDFIPQFTLNHIVKDIRYGEELCNSANFPMLSMASALQIYNIAESMGLGNLDYSAVFKSFRLSLGVKK